MQSEYMLRLAAALEADAANPEGLKFDMGEWGMIPSNISEGSVVKVNCGSMGCAFGLAALSGIFKNEGLTWRFHGRRFEGETTAKILIYYNGEEGFYAAADLFEISVSDAEWLFTPNYAENTGASSELLVAARIRQFVANGGERS